MTTSRVFIACVLALGLIATGCGSGSGAASASPSAALHSIVTLAHTEQDVDFTLDAAAKALAKNS